METVPATPLAERLRPRNLAEFYGQKHLLDKGKVLRTMIETDQVVSMIFWGPPGCGKTTLAHIIANATGANFIFFSAIMAGIKEIREIFKQAEAQAANKIRTILFVDEIHRFNKAQQDAFLPAVEKGLVTIIGATTENPSFEVISPLLSRCRVLKLQPLEQAELVNLLCFAINDQERGLGGLEITINDDALEFLTETVAGDARRALNTLDLAARLVPESSSQIDLQLMQEALQQKTLLYDKGGEEHYNVISAFIKSVRGSDPDAALYWLARMLEAGEDPLFILRRMIILASEDIGNADPRALQIAIAALHGFQMVGMPEGRIILGQTATYLATAPKSNASYNGIDLALAEVRKSGALAVPLHICNAPTKLMKEQGYHQGYRYAHDYKNSYVQQQYLPDKLQGKRFYTPKGIGYEKYILERMEWLKGKKGNNLNSEEI